MLIFDGNPFICWKSEKKRRPSQSVMLWVVKNSASPPPTPSEKYNSVSAWGSSVLHEAGWGELLSPQHARRKKRPCFPTERAPATTPTVNYHKLTLLIKLLQCASHYCTTSSQWERWEFFRGKKMTESAGMVARTRPGCDMMKTWRHFLQYFGAECDAGGRYLQAFWMNFWHKSPSSLILAHKHIYIQSMAWHQAT